MQKNNWLMKYKAKFKGLNIFIQGYLIVGILGLFLIFNITRHDTGSLIFLSTIFGLLFVSPFVINRCLYIVVYTITKAINDARNNQPTDKNN